MAYPGWTSSEWRDAAHEYVDTGDDAHLRALVDKDRSDAVKAAERKDLSGRLTARAIEVCKEIIATRDTTGWQAKDLAVAPPRPGDMPREEWQPRWKAFIQSHTEQIGSHPRRYIPDEYVCDHRHGMVAKYRMVRRITLGQGHTEEIRKLCEKHSKLLAAEQAVDSVLPEFPEIQHGRWGYVDIKDVVAGAA